MINKVIYSFILFVFLVSCKSKIDFTPVPVTYSSDLLITEVSTAINTDATAGNKRNHYVELFNGTENPVNMGNYAIGYNAVTDESTKAEWDFTQANFLPLSGTLASNICYVIGSAGADVSILNKSDITWGTTSTLSSDASKPLQLSGNSAIALLKKDVNGSYLINGDTYRIVDVFGSPLIDRVSTGGPNSARNNIMWTISGQIIDTRNRTFTRKATVHYPTRRWDLSKGTTAENSQWIISADRVWNYTDLKQHTLSAQIDAQANDFATITTASITAITNAQAQSGGNVIADGGTTVTARGICWSTLRNPTIALNTKTVNGTGTGIYTSTITGLAPSTIYYVRAYATNDAGTTYGIERQFTTPILRASDLVISEISTAINTDPNHTAVGAPTTLRNHYVELFNGTASAINLSDYAIGYQEVTDQNTLSAWSFPLGNYLLLSSNLSVDRCYVIASPQCNPNIIRSDITWGTTSALNADASKPLQLSGNSAIALLKKDVNGSHDLGGVKYSIIDVFGSPTVARVNTGGSSSARNNIIWTIAGETSDTRNRRFQRKSNVLNPTINWTLSKGTTALDSQWLISADRVWDLSNIGLPTQ